MKKQSIFSQLICKKPAKLMMNFIKCVPTFAEFHGIAEKFIQQNLAQH